MKQTAQTRSPARALAPSGQIVPSVHRHGRQHSILTPFERIWIVSIKFGDHGPVGITKGVVVFSTISPFTISSRASNRRQLSRAVHGKASGLGSYVKWAGMAPISLWSAPIIQKFMLTTLLLEMMGGVVCPHIIQDPIFKISIPSIGRKLWILQHSWYFLMIIKLAFVVWKKPEPRVSNMSCLMITIHRDMVTTPRGRNCAILSCGHSWARMINIPTKTILATWKDHFHHRNIWSMSKDSETLFPFTQNSHPFGMALVDFSKMVLLGKLRCHLYFLGKSWRMTLV